MGGKGGCLSSCFRDRSDESTRNARINAILEDERMRLRNQIKILLLGPGESGKSTVLKQMRIIHRKGPKREELESYKLTIYRNLIDAIKQTLRALDKMQVQFRTEDTAHYAKVISEFEFNDKDLDLRIPAEVVEGIRHFWYNTPLQKGFDAISRYSYVLESAPYFFNNLDRITTPGYIPTQEDFLRARIKTIGVTSEYFPMRGYDLSMIDVGGQRSERKKWFPAFDDVTIVLFCASLSDYDQYLLEDKSKGRILESLELFDFAINGSFFEDSSFILFMNKQDIFEEKIKTSPLELYFNDYTGGQDAEKAKQFILDKYLSLNHTKKPIYQYFTCATDTNMMEAVFDVIEENVISKALEFIIG